MIQALKSNENLTHVSRKTVSLWFQVLGTLRVMGGSTVSALQALVTCRCRRGILLFPLDSCKVFCFPWHGFLLLRVL